LAPLTNGKWKEKVLHGFGRGKDGYKPTASLIFDPTGNLYGTTAGGGSVGLGLGTVFQLTPRTNGKWKEKVLHSFGNGTDGANPDAGLIIDAAGNLYGTTPTGGAYSGYGTVFQLAPGTQGRWKEKVLHSFGNGTDGIMPDASVIIDAIGNLYGTTQLGGAYGNGTVFELNPKAGGGWTEKVLTSFNKSTDGTTPSAGLIFDAAGNLYGTAAYGGAYEFYGTVFRLASGTSGRWKETVLHSFTDNGTDGYYPYASLIFNAAGNLYGTTLEGGASGCAGGYETCGTIFEITP
jgi:uncharacterized repeat protein (TIGR03803 family)